MADQVIVACKLPSGLLAEVVNNSGVRVRVAFNGSAAARRLERADERGNPIDMGPLQSVKGGYGLTPVDADFWEQWIKENAEYPAVKAGLIFASSTSKGAATTPDAAAERAEIRSGLEPIDPNKPAPKIERLKQDA